VRKMRYVIAYDIADDRRRHQVAKFLEGWGRRVQESVFECDLSTEELEEVVSHLKALMNASEDRCHLYRICGECAPRRRALGLGDLEPEWAETVVT